MPVIFVKAYLHIIKKLDGHFQKKIKKYYEILSIFFLLHKPNVKLLLVKYIFLFLCEIIYAIYDVIIFLSILQDTWVSKKHLSKQKLIFRIYYTLWVYLPLVFNYMLIPPSNQFLPSSKPLIIPRKTKKKTHTVANSQK